MTIKQFSIASSISILIALSSCKKDTIEPETTTPTTPTYTVPTTYTFTNVNFSSSTQQINMLGELTSHIRSSHTYSTVTQPTIVAQTLKNMYSNSANTFTGSGLNESGIQLKSQTSTAFGLATELEAMFDEAENASVFAAKTPTSTSALNGTKGKLVSPTRAILVNASGFEYKELVEKGIMGGVFYYKATSLLNSISNFDNITKENGVTAQERSWDEAFGYFGVPVDFPANTTGLKNWGSYANSVNAAISCNSVLMDAFLKGRAAISNKDAAARDAAVKTIVNMWEKVAAAKCIVYMKSAKANLMDNAAAFHALTEGYGFINAFKYNTAKTISDTDINSLMNEFGGNLYTMTQTNMDNVISKLASVFNIDTTKL